MSDFTRKPTRAKAIQFDGTNGKEVADFAKEHGATNISRGGGWVKILDDNHGAIVKLRRDDYLVVDSDESFRRYNDDEFFRYFQPYPKKRSVKR